MVSIMFKLALAIAIYISSASEIVLIISSKTLILYICGLLFLDFTTSGLGHNKKSTENTIAK